MNEPTVSRQKMSVLCRTVPVLIIASVLTHSAMDLLANKSSLSTVTKHRIEKLREVCHSAWPSSLIRGGEEVSKPFKYPFMGLIGKFERRNRRHVFRPKCGAALLNKEFALSAAHCFPIGRKKSDILRLREHDLRNDDDVEDSTIAEVILHPGYELPRQMHDIALVRLRDPVNLSDTIAPVCLPLEYHDYDASNTNILALGWGLLTAGGASSDILREVSVPVVPHNKCRETYGQTTVLETAYEDGKPPLDTTICAVDTCQSDSGGPILYDASVVEDGTKRYELAGITSLGVGGCGNPSFPSIYTKVWPYLDWITETMHLKGKFDA